MADPFEVRVTGPLSSLAHEFATELIGAGYSPRTARDHVYVLARLSRWLTDEHLATAQLTPEAVDRFLLARHAAGCRRWRTLRSMQPMLAFLRGVRAVPEAEVVAPDSAVEAMVGAYRLYLVGERRLATAGVLARSEVARRFLSMLDGGHGLQLDRLTPAQVTKFVLGESRRYRPSSMKVLTVALRCLLRYLFLSGVVDRNLSASVPTVANRPMTGLSRGVDDATVTALLAGCDLSTPVGVRDHAILTLLVRLGLRAGEVAALRLEDVDWRAGEIVIHGKGNRVDRLPLPADVGTVLVDYLRRGRRRSACRSLFLRACAPDGAMSAGSVTMVPRTASTRAGLEVVGAHRLRHAAATGMLRAGAPLREIAQALRHRSEASTARYAAVDRAALQAVVRPWPQAGR